LPSPEVVRKIFALRERGVPVEAIAREVGLSPVSVRHALCLRRLIPAALEAFFGGRLPFARALALSREPPEAQARRLGAGGERRGAPPGPERGRAKRGPAGGAKGLAGRVARLEAELEGLRADIERLRAVKRRLEAEVAWLERGAAKRRAEAALLALGRRLFGPLEREAEEFRDALRTCEVGACAQAEALGWAALLEWYARLIRDELAAREGFVVMDAGGDERKGGSILAPPGAEEDGAARPAGGGGEGGSARCRKLKALDFG